MYFSGSLNDYLNNFKEKLTFGKEASFQPIQFFVSEFDIKFRILLKGFVCPNIISHFYLLIYLIYLFTIFCAVTMNRTETLKFSGYPHPQKSSIFFF